jgi:hypothetical protein
MNRANVQATVPGMILGPCYLDAPSATGDDGSYKMTLIELERPSSVIYWSQHAARHRDVMTRSLLLTQVTA